MSFTLILDKVLKRNKNQVMGGVRQVKIFKYTQNRKRNLMVSITFLPPLLDIYFVGVNFYPYFACRLISQ